MFPHPVASNVTNGSTATTSATVNLPAGIKGNMLLVSIHRANGVGAIGWPSEGTGWIQLIEDSSDASDDVTSIAYKWTLATDAGATTMTVTQGNFKFSNVTWLIDGAANPSIRAPELSTIAVGTTTPINPTTVTPTGGIKDYLWLWIGTMSGEQTTPPATAPTGYSTPMIAANSGTGGVATTNCRIATAWKKATAASEDPPTVNISASSAGWNGWGMAVHPMSPMKFGAINHQNPAIM